MITIENTPNLTGVKISGDFNDFYNLVEAFHEITVSDDSQKNHLYIPISIRVLGLCYDIRHAYQGDREVTLVDNNLDENKMKWHSIIAPKTNVYYSCNYLYPEMFFIMLALNELVALRQSDLTKVKPQYGLIREGKVLWDHAINQIRLFQTAFANCFKETVTPNTYARWLNTMNPKFSRIVNIMGQYVDMLNIEYIKMSKEKRLKNLTRMARKVADFWADEEHDEIEEVVYEAALKYKCEPGSIQLEGIEYPDDIEW